MLKNRAINYYVKVIEWPKGLRVGRNRVYGLGYHEVTNDVIVLLKPYADHFEAPTTAKNKEVT